MGWSPPPNYKPKLLEIHTCKVSTLAAISDQPQQSQQLRQHPCVCTINEVGPASYLAHT